MRIAIEALYDAADDDTATGGPDLIRKLYPIVAAVDRGRLPPLRLDARSNPVVERHHRATVPRTREAAVTMPFGYVEPRTAGPRQDRVRRARASRAGAASWCLTYADGILFVAEIPSVALHKISEIYDRIAFAAVGKYNEFENLRRRRPPCGPARLLLRPPDVTAAPGQRLRADPRPIFTESPSRTRSRSSSPRSAAQPDDDQIYRLTFDGSVADEHGFVAMGGALRPGHHLAQGAPPRRPVPRRRVAGGGAGTDRSVPPGLPQNGERVLKAANLEVGMLDRTRARRQFKRIGGLVLEDLLAQTASA